MSVDDLHGKGIDPIQSVVNAILKTALRDPFAALEEVSPGISKKLPIRGNDPIPQDVVDAIAEVRRRGETG